MIGFDYSGKNYIVTGGAGGMGSCVVRGIAAGGGKVALVDLNEEAAAKIVAENPEQIHFYKMDLADHEDIRTVAAQIIRDFGQVHGLVNLAGIVDTTKFMDMTDEIWDRVMNINLTSQYVLIHALFGHMAERRYGRIVNVASVAAKVGGGLFGTSAYAVSKAGVVCLTKAIAKEGSPYGIVCNAVCPGYVKTPLVAALKAEQEEKVLAGSQLHRPADPQEVANLMLFYLSDLASFIDGEIGDADGGATLD